jgi:hypothetical protein
VTPGRGVSDPGTRTQPRATKDPAPEEREDRKILEVWKGGHGSQGPSRPFLLFLF